MPVRVSNIATAVPKQASTKRRAALTKGFRRGSRVEITITTIAVMAASRPPSAMPAPRQASTVRAMHSPSPIGDTGQKARYSAAVAAPTKVPTTRARVAAQVSPRVSRSTTMPEIAAHMAPISAAGERTVWLTAEPSR